jgi:hypothetical protein
MLGHPDAPIAPCLGMGRKIARILKRHARIGLLSDAGKLKDGERGHGLFLRSEKQGAKVPPQRIGLAIYARIDQLGPR